jgi:hypothetical protein
VSREPDGQAAEGADQGHIAVADECSHGPRITPPALGVLNRAAMR